MILVDDEREPIPGYDFIFAPCRPVDPEYRQLYRERQLMWLDEWAPPIGYWPQ